MSIEKEIRRHGKIKIFCERIREYPNDNFLIIAPSYRIMDLFTLPAFKEYALQIGLIKCWKCSYNKSNFYIKHDHGKGRISLRSAYDPDSIEGPSARCVLFDGSEECSELSKEIARTRILSLKGGILW